MEKMMTRRNTRACWGLLRCCPFEGEANKLEARSWKLEAGSRKQKQKLESGSDFLFVDFDEEKIRLCSLS